MAKRETRVGPFCKSPVTSGFSAAMQGLVKASKSLTEQRAKTKSPIQRFELELRIKAVKSLAAATGQVGLFVFRK
jgi:hypothetical protein